MSTPRKPGIEPVPAMAGLGDFPELKTGEKFPYQFDANGANKEIADWWRDVVRVLTEENDALRRRVEALEAKAQ